MKVIYIAGPLKADNAWAYEQNVRAAEAVALELWSAGFAAICPHSSSRFFMGTLPERTWLDGDLEILSRCDGLLVIGDWASSEGTKEEMAHARRLGIPIFKSVLGAKMWASGQG